MGAERRMIGDNPGYQAYKDHVAKEKEANRLKAQGEAIGQALVGSRKKAWTTMGRTAPSTGAAATAESPPWPPAGRATGRRGARQLR